MRAFTQRLTVFAMIAAGSLVATQARAESPLAGTYKYVGGEKDINAMYAAVDKVVSKMNFLIRGIARKKIRKPNMPSPELDLELTPSTVTLARTGQDTVSAPRDGRPIVWKDHEGGEFNVKYELNGDSVLQTMDGKSAHTTNLFTLEPDGTTLKVDTKIISERLPAPVIFEMTYRKK